MTIRNQKNITAKTNEMDIENQILKNEKECRKGFFAGHKFQLAMLDPVYDLLKNDFECRMSLDPGSI